MSGSSPEFKVSPGTLLSDVASVPAGFVEQKIDSGHSTPVHYQYWNGGSTAALFWSSLADLKSEQCPFQKSDYAFADQ